MKTQLNLDGELDLLFKVIQDLDDQIQRMKTGYSRELERYIEKAEELATLHRALYTEVNRNRLTEAEERLRRETMVELQLEIENFQMPPAPDPTFYFTELNTLEARQREFQSRLMRRMAYAASQQAN
ncbi:hypothetical protein [Tellurirhabdus rosea]|uniref:hypothetical protein n=1 Tax=Tellurirhabdus rosea TaxID=2674997 RepID=UPI002251AAC8|nr:hypothetical protein [Tellurirhabdus rosea]